MGTDGFEFIEYAAPDPAALGKLFETDGLSRRRPAPPQERDCCTARAR
jgi:4-hydroxyphenylpyruvate dioxygenase-like putative hemolysin